VCLVPRAMASSWLLEHCRLCCNNRIGCESNVNPDLVRGLILDFSGVRLGPFPPYVSASSEGRTTYGNNVLKRQSSGDFSLSGQGQHQASSRQRLIFSDSHTFLCTQQTWMLRNQVDSESSRNNFFSHPIFILPDFILVMTGNAGFVSSPSIPL